MPLVEAGYQSGPQNCGGCPARRPPHARHGGKGGAPCPEEQDAEDAVTGNVAPFSDVEVPNLEAIPVEANEIVQKRIENSAGVMRRKQSAGFDGDENKPQNRGNPGLQNVVTFGVQAQILLDAIVGSLACNHDVVDVALAESRAADADEARLLKEFGDGGAAAVTHA